MNKVNARLLDITGISLLLSGLPDTTPLKDWILQQMPSATDTSLLATKAALDALSATVAGITPAAQAYTDAAIASLIGGSPEALNTLQEIVTAFEAGDTSLASLLSTKADATFVPDTQNAVGFDGSTQETIKSAVDKLAAQVALTGTNSFTPAASTIVGFDGTVAYTTKDAVDALATALSTVSSSSGFETRITALESAINSGAASLVETIAITGGTPSIQFTKEFSTAYTSNPANFALYVDGIRVQESMYTVGTGNMVTLDATFANQFKATDTPEFTATFIGGLVGGSGGASGVDLETVKAMVKSMVKSVNPPLGTVVTTGVNLDPYYTQANWLYISGYLAKGIPLGYKAFNRTVVNKSVMSEDWTTLVPELFKFGQVFTPTELGHTMTASDLKFPYVNSSGVFAVSNTVAPTGDLLDTSNTTPVLTIDNTAGASTMKTFIGFWLNSTVAFSEVTINYACNKYVRFTPVLIKQGSDYINNEVSSFDDYMGTSATTKTVNLKGDPGVIDISIADGLELYFEVPVGAKVEIKSIEVKYDVGTATDTDWIVLPVNNQNGMYSNSTNGIRTYMFTGVDITKA